MFFVSPTSLVVMVTVTRPPFRFSIPSSEIIACVQHTAVQDTPPFVSVRSVDAGVHLPYPTCCAPAGGPTGICQHL